MKLKAAIVNCKQKGMSVATYFATLKQLWDGLANYERREVRDCEKRVKELIKQQEKEKRQYTFFFAWTPPFWEQFVPQF